MRNLDFIKALTRALLLLALMVFTSTFTFIIITLIFGCSNTPITAQDMELKNYVAKISAKGERNGASVLKRFKNVDTGELIVCYEAFNVQMELDSGLRVPIHWLCSDVSKLDKLFKSERKNIPAPKDKRKKWIKRPYRKTNPVVAYTQLD